MQTIKKTLFVIGQHIWLRVRAIFFCTLYFLPNILFIAGLTLLIVTLNFKNITGFEGSSLYVLFYIPAFIFMLIGAIACVIKEDPVNLTVLFTFTTFSRYFQIVKDSHGKISVKKGMNGGGSNPILALLLSVVLVAFWAISIPFCLLSSAFSLCLSSYVGNDFEDLRQPFSAIFFTPTIILALIPLLLMSNYHKSYNPEKHLTAEVVNHDFHQEYNNQILSFSIRLKNDNNDFQKAFFNIGALHYQNYTINLSSNGWNGKEILAGEVYKIQYVYDKNSSTFKDFNPMNVPYSSLGVDINVFQIQYKHGFYLWGPTYANVNKIG